MPSIHFEICDLRKWQLADPQHCPSARHLIYLHKLESLAALVWAAHSCTFNSHFAAVSVNFG